MAIDCHRPPAARRWPHVDGPAQPAGAPGPAAARRARRARHRPPAVRRGPRPADHLPARPRRPPACCSTTQPFADPASLLLISPTTTSPGCCTPTGVPLDRAGGRGGSAAARPQARAGVAAAVRELARVPRHPGAVLVRQRAGRDLRRHPAAERRQRRRALRPDRRASCAEDAFRPRALLTAVRHRGAGHHRRPGRRPGRARGAARQDPTCATRVIPTFRPDRYLEPAAPGWADAVKQLGAAARIDVGDYAGYVAALEERRPVLHRARRHLGRPQPPRRPRRAAGARRGAAHLLRWR